MFSLNTSFSGKSEGALSMVGCVLQVSGVDFEPQSFLAGSSFKPCNVFQKGERRYKSSSVWSSSGFAVVVSDEDGTDLESQVDDAVKFLRRNQQELTRLQRYEGVTDIRLEFCVYRLLKFVQSSYLPPELLVVAGFLRVGIEISIYDDDSPL